MSLLVTSRLLVAQIHDVAARRSGLKLALVLTGPDLRKFQRVAGDVRRYHLPVDTGKLHELAFGVDRFDIDGNLAALNFGGNLAIGRLGGFARPANGLLPESIETGPLQPVGSPSAVD